MNSVLVGLDQRQEGGLLRLFAKLFLLSLPLSLLVDSLNGWLIREGMAMPVSSVYKVALLAFGAVFLSMSSSRYLAAQIVAMLLLLTCSLVHLIRDGRVEVLTADLEWGARALLITTYYFVFSELIRRRTVSIRDLVWASVAGWSIVSINLAVGLAGLGFAQYDDRYGTAGFFYAGNELAVLMVALGVLPLAYAYSCRTVGVYLLLVGMFMTAALVTLTKTAMMGLLMLAFLIPAIDMFVSWLRHGSLSGRSVRYAAAASFVLLCSGAAAWWFVQATGFLDRVMYFFDRGGWSAVIFSGRDTMVEAAVTEFLNSSGSVDLLAGKGVLWFSERLGGQTESDLVDFGIAFGLPAAALTFAALAAICVRAAFVYCANPEYRLPAGVSAVFGVLAVIIAIMAGHVLNSGTAAATIGAVLATWRAGTLPAPQLRWRF